MDKTILCLMLLGIGLTLLHVPSVVLTLGVILGLVGLTVKLFWSMMQAFSSNATRRAKSPT